MGLPATLSSAAGAVMLSSHPVQASWLPPLHPRDLSRAAAALRQGPDAARALLADLLFCRALEELGALSLHPLRQALADGNGDGNGDGDGDAADPAPVFAAWAAFAEDARRRLGVPVLAAPPPALPRAALLEALDALRARSVSAAGFDALGYLHERLLASGHKDVGRYYTRPELVRAMAEATVGRLADAAVEEAAGARLLSLRVLDPACGTGPFLIAAAEILRRAYLRFIESAPACAQGLVPAPEALRRIVGNLRGVDLDPAAVLAARRNTWLWLLRAGAAPPLPSLEAELRCADALLDPPPPGSADVVLGNPPYIGEEGHKDLFRAVARAPLGRYYEGKMDYACFFVHLGLDALADGGVLSFLLPSYLQTAAGSRRLNQRLCAEATIEEIRDFGEFPVFSATAPGLHSTVLRLRKARAPDGRPLVARLLRDASYEEIWTWRETVPGPGPRGDIGPGEDTSPWICYAAPPQRELLDERGALHLLPGGAAALCRQMAAAGPPLRTLAAVDTGLQAGPGTLTARAAAALGRSTPDSGPGPGPSPGAGVFVLSAAERRALHLSPDEERLLRPFHHARQVRRYAADPKVAHEILYLTARTCPDLSPYPNVARHLAPFVPLLKKRRETQLGMRAYFHLHWPREEAIFLAPKILCRRQAARPCFAFSEGPYFVDLALNIIRPRAQGPDLFALLALLNSAPAHFWFYHRGKRKGELLQLDGAPLGALPIPALSAKEEAALSRLGRRLSALHVDGDGPGGPDRRAGGTSRLIREAEDEADELAARCYGLRGLHPALLREPWELARFA